MKKIASFGAALLVSCAMAFSMTACTPTANNPLQQDNPKSFDEYLYMYKCLLQQR